MKRALFAIFFTVLFSLQVDAQRILAHRGGRMEEDENTLAAFRNTLQKGCFAFETDVRITKDGEYVIMHDGSMERTTMGKGQIEELTSEYIRSVKTKKGNRVPLLRELVEFLNQYDGLYVEFEMKTDEMRYPENLLHKYCDDIHEIIMSGKPKNSIYLFTSFDVRPLEYLKGKYADADVGWITGDSCNRKTVEQCCSLGIKRLAATLDGTTRSAVKYAHEHGITVNLWPGSIPEDSALAANLGADYLCTDVPHLVMKHIREHNLPIAYGAIIDGREVRDLTAITLAQTSPRSTNASSANTPTANPSSASTPNTQTAGTPNGEFQSAPQLSNPNGTCQTISRSTNASSANTPNTQTANPSSANTPNTQTTSISSANTPTPPLPRPFITDNTIASHRAGDHIFLSEKKGSPQSTVALNPVNPIDSADPSIVKIKDTFYMFVTGFPIRIYKSKNLCDWEFHRNMFPGSTPDDPYGTGEKDPMHTGAKTPSYWAPSPALIKGKVVVYLTLFVSLENDRQVVCVADDIDGAFKYAGTLNVGTPEHPTPQDGQFFRDDDGRIYLVWGDVHSNGNFVRELSKDGLSYAKGSVPHYITSEYEGGFIYKHKGRYYFFASKGYYNDAAYTLCMSSAESLEGPWSPMEPVLMSERPDAVLNGPGHNGEIFTDRLGRMFMIMHAHCEDLIPIPDRGLDHSPEEIYRPRPAILMELKEIDGTLRFVDHHGRPTTHPQWLVNVPAM